MIIDTVKENIPMQVEKYMKVNGKMIKELVKEKKLMNVEEYIKVNG